MILIVTGLPGRGKSKFAQYLMWALDRQQNNKPRASLQNWTCTQADFADAVDRNADDTGRVIVWEEPYVGGVQGGGANSRAFMSQANLQISTLFQTMRTNRHVIVLTLPFAGAFDLQARNVAHGTVFVTSNNGHYSVAKFYLREVNPVFGKTYNKNLTFMKDGRRKKMVNIFCGLPPKEFGDACDDKSNWFKAMWRKQIAKGPTDRKTILGSVRAKAILDISLNREKYTRQVKTHDGIVDKPDYVKGGKIWRISPRTFRDWWEQAVVTI